MQYIKRALRLDEDTEFNKTYRERILVVSSIVSDPAKLGLLRGYVRMLCGNSVPVGNGDTESALMLLWGFLEREYEGKGDKKHGNDGQRRAAVRDDCG